MVARQQHVSEMVTGAFFLPCPSRQRSRHSFGPQRASIVKVLPVEKRRQRAPESYDSYMAAPTPGEPGPQRMCGNGKEVPRSHLLQQE